jgi:hypothetical protein
VKDLFILFCLPGLIVSRVQRLPFCLLWSRQVTLVFTLSPKAFIEKTVIMRLFGQDSLDD